MSSKKIITLTKRQHWLLCEALRRHTRFNLTDLNQPLKWAWTGLGPYTLYKPVLDGGLMTYATSPNPGHTTWWRLTDLGAAIVTVWLDQGYSYLHIERGNVPPRLVFVEEECLDEMS